ncbi:Histidine kinase A [Pelomyxa schiedti]|nr:Histidine kinase A [Pelomyxa schiedti]
MGDSNNNTLINPYTLQPIAPPTHTQKQQQQPPRPTITAVTAAPAVTSSPYCITVTAADGNTKDLGRNSPPPQPIITLSPSASSPYSPPPSHAAALSPTRFVADTRGYQYADETPPPSPQSPNSPPRGTHGIAHDQQPPSFVADVRGYQFASETAIAEPHNDNTTVPNVDVRGYQFGCGDSGSNSSSSSSNTSADKSGGGGGGGGADASGYQFGCGEGTAVNTGDSGVGGYGAPTTNSQYTMPSTGTQRNDAPSGSVGATAVTGEATQLPWKEKTLHWNEQFQNIIKQEDGLEKYSQIAQFANDFVYSASLYGKIIISELGMPEKEKTIKPISIGGIAGGEKYIVRGIFFKLAIDKHNLYNSDEKAAKGAGHELKGLQSYYNCHIPGLCLPLFVLIDYKGYRLSATSVLPIRSDTIKYGSSDAALHIHTEIPELNRKMEEAAAMLNLKGHAINGKLLHSAVDVEVHQGLDGNFYIVDSARVFPPEAPLDDDFVEKRRYLYSLLRPELVKSSPVPLSSDAYSSFDRNDPNCDENREDLMLATLRLTNEVIPMFAQKLEAQILETGTSDLNLAQSLHKAGINVRHLMRLYHCCTTPIARTTILTESVARAVKSIIRGKLRKRMKRPPFVPTELPYKQIIIDCFNTVLGHNVRKSEKLWSYDLPAWLKENYRSGYNRDLKTISPKQVQMFLLMTRVQEMIGTYLTPQANEQLKQNPDTFIALPPDIGTMEAKIKQLNIAYYAEGYVLLVQAMNSTRKDASRLWALAEDKLALAVGSTTDSQSALFQWANLIFEKAKRRSPSARMQLLKVALKKIQSASELGKNRKVDLLWGCLLAHVAALKDDPEKSPELYMRAGAKFEEALSFEPHCLDELVESAMASQKHELGALLETAMQCAPQLLRVLQRHLHLLKGSLELDHAGRLTEPTILWLIKNSDPFISISLLGCSHVTDKILVELANGKSSQLHDLELVGCPLVTPEAVTTFVYGATTTPADGEAVLSFPTTPAPVLASLSLDDAQASAAPAITRKGVSVFIISTKDHLRTADKVEAGKPKIYYITQNTIKYQEVVHILTTWNVRQKPISIAATAAGCTAENFAKKVVKDMYGVLKRPLFYDKSDLLVGEHRFLGHEFDQIGVEKFGAMYKGMHATASTVVACTLDGDEIMTFKGKVEGVIVYPPRASDKGFGWDSIFVPDDYSNTLSEMIDHKFVVNTRHKPFIQLSYTLFDRAKHMHALLGLRSSNFFLDMRSSESPRTGSLSPRPLAASHS